MSVPAPIDPRTPERLHADGIAAFEAGDATAAAELLRAAARASFDPSVLNDLAVVLAGLGEDEPARILLAAVLELDPDNADAQANLEQLGDRREVDAAAWRESATLGGPDPRMPERAYPGMLSPTTMSEHATRYSLALGMVAGRDVLDVGCGTGYGSEMLTWTASRVRGFDLWQPSMDERPRWSGGAELTYGFDVTKHPLPAAEVAVMFEIIEHLDDAQAALRNVFSAAGALLASFPNPTYHGSHLNHHHVNDWTLEQFEHEVQSAALAAGRFTAVKLHHMHQPHGWPSIVKGRDPEAPFWILLAVGETGAR